MGGFFRGWRRKVGIFTLVMTCVFMSGWVRSFSKADGLNSAGSQFISHHGGIFCQIVPDIFDFHFSCYSTDEKMMRNAYSHASCAEIWAWKTLGFAYGNTTEEMKNGDGSTSKVTLLSLYFPYWSIVLPLAVISACLLLLGSAQPTHRKPLCADEE